MVGLDDAHGLRFGNAVIDIWHPRGDLSRKLLTYCLYSCFRLLYFTGSHSTTGGWMRWWERHFGDSTRGRIVAILRRGWRSVDEIAATLGLTDNAVRAHIATLERDGVVAAAGSRRDGSVGKPATLYGVAEGADTLFS